MFDAFIKYPKCDLVFFCVIDNKSIKCSVHYGACRGRCCYLCNLEDKKGSCSAEKTTSEIFTYLAWATKKISEMKLNGECNDDTN